MKPIALTVVEVKKNLCIDIGPGTYKLEDVLVLNDRPAKKVNGRRRVKGKRV